MTWDQEFILAVENNRMSILRSVSSKRKPATKVAPPLTIEQKDAIKRLVVEGVPTVQIPEKISVSLWQIRSLIKKLSEADPEFRSIAQENSKRHIQRVAFGRHRRGLRVSP